ncbi:SMP-30/gluconolactonase/LRE family protein [Candidatus Latescibacterota bacterium]
MNKLWYGFAIILVSGFLVGCGSDARNETPEMSDEIKSVTAPGAVPIELANIDEYVGERSKSEGPVTDSEDNVYFSNPYGTKLFKWSRAEGLTVFSEKIKGPNGLDIDSGGNIIACEAHNRRIVSLGKDSTVTVLADSFDGKKFNEPNDLFIDRNGGIYFSDPYFHVHYEPLEQENSDLYYITPDRSNVLRVIDDMINPNGICSSPDGSLLYVIDTGEETTYVYDVNADGTLSGKRVFVRWGIDGLTVDSEGNVYITGAEDYVNIYDAEGEFIEKIVVPITKGHTSNVCFGVKDKQTLFITAGNSLFSIKMRVKGFQ